MPPSPDNLPATLRNLDQRVGLKSMLRQPGRVAAVPGARDVMKRDAELAGDEIEYHPKSYPVAWKKKYPYHVSENDFVLKMLNHP